MGKPRNTQKYPTYPEIPEIPGNTRKKKRYPEIPDHIFRHSYPTRTRPATRYFVQYQTRPDTEKPYPLGTGCHGLYYLYERVSASMIRGCWCWWYYQSLGISGLTGYYWYYAALRVPSIAMASNILSYPINRGKGATRYCHHHHSLDGRPWTSALITNEIVRFLFFIYWGETSL